MKKIIFLVIFKASAFASFSQDTIPSVSLTRQDYLQKSKSQKTTAKILKHGGGALAVTGILLLSDDIAGWFDPNDNDNSSVATVLLCAGAALAIISIPMQIAARKNEQKAISMSFKNIQVPQMTTRSLVQTSIPSLTVRIGL